MNADEHREAVNAAIDIVTGELRPWIEQRIEVWPPDQRGKVSPYDPSYLITVLLDNWRTHFVSILGAEGMTLVQEFRHTRNRSAHREPFAPLDAFRAIDTCRLLARAIGSNREEELIGAALQILNDGSAETPAVRRSSTESRPAKVSSGQHRKAKSLEFRQDWWRRRFEPHIEPINRLVDRLIADHDDRWMPYVAPDHGGIDSRIVLLFQDPGPMTAPINGGSGFIGCENDDPSANLLSQCLDSAGVAQRAVIPWNSYPWFLPAQSGVTVAMRVEGIEPLRSLLKLLDKAHTMVTCGKVAHDTWNRFARLHPVEAARFRHFETFHTSGRGITNGGQQTKQAGIEHVIETLCQAKLLTGNGLK